MGGAILELIDFCGGETYGDSMLTSDGVTTNCCASV